VPGAGDTPRGKILHFILPVVFFANKSHHSCCALLAVWVGGSQVETVNTVCADTALATKPNVAKASDFNFIWLLSIMN
jgi:hypothetical protein